MRNPPIDREKRAESQAQLLTILNALLDHDTDRDVGEHPQLAIMHAQVCVQQHSGSYLAYIELVGGSFGEQQYDRLREVVGGLGGQVIVLGQDVGTVKGANLRIWPA